MRAQLEDKDRALEESRKQVEHLQHELDGQMKRALEAERALADSQALLAKQFANDRELEQACRELLSEVQDSESQSGCPLPFRVDDMESLTPLALARGTVDCAEGQAVCLTFPDGSTGHGTLDGQALKWNDGSMWKRDPQKLLGVWSDAGGEKIVMERGAEQNRLRMRDNSARPLADVTVPPPAGRRAFYYTESMRVATSNPGKIHAIK